MSRAEPEATANTPPVYTGKSTHRLPSKSGEHSGQKLPELKRARLRAGLSQRKLGEMTGKSGPDICRLEKQRAWVTERTLILLADRLGCEPEELTTSPSPLPSASEFRQLTVYDALEESSAEETGSEAAR